MRAESYEQVAKGHIEARGLVDLNLAGMRIQADKADIFEVTHPDGKQGHRVVAEGNVAFIRGDERLGGETLEMDDTGHGFLTNAVGYIEPGVYVEGRRVERVDDKTYKVEGGRFTSCSQPNPRWGFQSSSAEIQVDDKVKATNAVFKLKGIPIFYTPYLVYPISHDGRSSGILFPHFGYSSFRGYNTGTGFFWVNGRSADQTFYADYWSKLGNGYGHELRYVLQSPSRGNFRTYVFDVKGAEELDYDLDWNALQILPGKVKVALNVRQYSDLLFQQRYQDDFNAATSRTQRWQGSIEKDLKLAVLSAYADTTSTYFGTDYTQRQRPPARPRATALPAPDRLGQGGGRARRHRRAAPVRGRGERRLLGALRRGALHLAALRPELPRVHAVGALPIHALRRELRHVARRERGRVHRDRRPAPRPLVLRDAGGDARADLREGVGHARLRVLRALQARDRPRGAAGPTARASTTTTRSPSSTATTTSSGPTRSTTRWCSASTPSGGGPSGKSGPSSS